jgi:orotidine-5'-phosphate decarboxylase
MGETVKMAAGELFDWLKFDCVMVTPWFGFDTLRDYFDYDDKGVLVYIHDSNPSAAEIQDLTLADGRKVYEAVAEKVAKKTAVKDGEDWRAMDWNQRDWANEGWNLNGNLWAEAGATYPRQLKRIREIIGQDMPLLAAGIGAQGGKAEDLRGLFGTNGRRLLVNSSRGIIFAGLDEKAADYFAKVRDAAKSLRDELWEIAEL